MDGVSIPSKMQWRVKELKGILKQTISLEPSIGVNILKSGQQIRVDLPPNSLVDLSTFLMSYVGYTNEGGSDAGGATGYRQVRYFPRNSASIIQNLEIQINGQSRFNCPDYNLIYNILHDFSQGQDGLSRRAIGENADPSCKYFNTDVTINTTAFPKYLCSKNGYPVGLTTTDSAVDKDTYVIRSWLGIFQGSTSIIDTSMLGLVTIILTLAPSAITALGTANTAPITALNATGVDPVVVKTVPSNTVGASNADYADEPTMRGKTSRDDGVASLTTERIVNNSGVDIVAGLALAGAVAEAGKDYFLNNVKFSIVRYDMPSSYYNGLANNLASGATYKLYYPNYSVFTGQPVNSLEKSGVLRFSISTQSLDYVIGTFRAANYDNNDNATNKVVLSNTSPLYLGQFGSEKCNFENQVRDGKPILFNNSKYFVRNGESLTEATWSIGNTRLLTEKPVEIFDGVLRHFNIQNDVLGGLHPSIKSLQQFNKYAFAHILSLNVSGEGGDIYTVSGLNSEETPVNVAWEYKGTPFQNDATWGLTATGQNCTPVAIACYSSHLEINAGRNIVSVS